MQALYAEEAVVIAQNTADVSKAELDRARVMHEVGTISRVDLAQLESQWASDSYQVVVSQATLNDYKLQLKQLLELDILEEIELADADFGEERILSLLPEKSSVYSRAMDSMPQIARFRLEIRSLLLIAFLQSGATRNRTRDTRIFSPLQPTARKQSLAASNWLIYGLIPILEKQFSLTSIS